MERDPPWWSSGWDSMMPVQVRSLLRELGPECHLKKRPRILPVATKILHVTNLELMNWTKGLVILFKIHHREMEIHASATKQNRKNRKNAISEEKCWNFLELMKDLNHQIHCTQIPCGIHKKNTKTRPTGIKSQVNKGKKSNWCKEKEKSHSKKFYLEW